MRAELFRPAGSSSSEASSPPAPLGGVVLVHEVFGLDAATRLAAERLARAGYVTLVPDLYSRAGVPGPPSTAEQPAPAWALDEIRAALAQLPDRRAAADLAAAAEYLAQLPEVGPQRVAAIGFCMGGTQAFLLACKSQHLSAVVSCYGRICYPDLSETRPVQPLELALNIEAPLLAVFGDLDSSIPAQDIAALEAALGRFARPLEVLRFPEADHGFMNPLRGAYREADAEAAWQRVLAFLDEVL